MKPVFDPLAQRYSSQRYPVYARNGMVNCSCPQAASAGLELLQAGGRGNGTQTVAFIIFEVMLVSVFIIEVYMD